MEKKSQDNGVLDTLWLINKIYPVEGQKLCAMFARQCALSVVDTWDAPLPVIKYLTTGNVRYHSTAMLSINSITDVSVGRLSALNAIWAGDSDDLSCQHVWASESARFAGSCFKKSPEFKEKIKVLSKEIIGIDQLPTELPPEFKEPEVFRGSSLNIFLNMLKNIFVFFTRP